VSTESKTETALARIFAICDEVAETGETVRTEDEGRDDARAWLGIPCSMTPNDKNQAQAIDHASAGPPFVVPERNAQKLIALFQAKYCLGDKGSTMTSAALDRKSVV
jgi:hypothetical protein